MRQTRETCRKVLCFLFALPSLEDDRFARANELLARLPENLLDTNCLVLDIPSLSLLPRSCCVAFKPFGEQQPLR